ncbi:hypothetical protein Hanom_Chr08g00727321 [Helianthus anomalus]
MPSNVFDSFAGFFGEPTTGFCPRYEAEKTTVQEIIDVSKEMNEETLKEIADKDLMVKLQEVEQTKTSSDNNEIKEATQESVSVEKKSILSENVKSESEGKTENEESKSGEKTESESRGFGKSENKNDKQENALKSLIQFLKCHAKTV